MNTLPHQSQLHVQRSIVMAYKSAQTQLYIEAAEIQQLTHEPHIREHFQNAIDTLTMHMDAERAVLIRMQTVGR